MTLYTVNILYIVYSKHSRRIMLCNAHALVYLGSSRADGHWLFVRVKFTRTRRVGLSGHPTVTVLII